MPHTINLVSQFEDIIRRGGNELDNNIVSAVKTGWGYRTGSKRKRSPRRASNMENDDEPPPIPKRVPIVSTVGTSMNPRNNYVNPEDEDEDKSHLRDLYQEFVSHEENGDDIFTISNTNEVCHNLRHNIILLIGVNLIPQYYTEYFKLDKSTYCRWF